MYDLTKMKTGLNVKCKDLAKELMKYPEAEIAICGDSWVYLHVEQDGSIVELDNYTTFFTPRLIIKYNMMGIDDYRTLMTFLMSKNTFMVTCYDEVADRRVTHEMYFAPPSMPIIYQRYLSVLGIQEQSIELIGTNNRDNTPSGVFWLDEVMYYSYYDEDWIHFTIRNETIYKVVYSVKLKRFIVSKDGGKTGLRLSQSDSFVNPYDVIAWNAYYESVEVISP